MKKNKVRISGANVAPLWPMFAMATSFRMNNTIASIAPPKPLGALPRRWRRSTCQPAYFMVTNTSSAATSMNTTCLVGETSRPNRRQLVGSCHSPNPNGSSTTWLSAVWRKIMAPISGSWPCIIAGTWSPQRAAATRRRGSRATSRAAANGRGAAPRASTTPPETRLVRPCRRASAKETAVAGRSSRAGAARSRRAAPVSPWPHRSRRAYRRAGRLPRPAPRPILRAKRTASRLALPAPGSPLPAVLLHLIVDPHEPREPAEKPAGDGEERQGMQPAVDQPAECAEGENGEREGEAQGDVRPALAVALARLVVAIWHQPSGNLSACEIFRKQTVRPANLCGAWEYDMLTLPTP